MKDIYPLTIVKDRYDGVYSGGSWTAWNTDFFAIPQEIEGDDVTCECWWGDFNSGKTELKNIFNEKVYVGKGNTLEKAIDDLKIKVKIKST